MLYIQRLILAFALVFVLAGPTLAQDADTEYAALVQEARKMEAGFDYDKLRWLYTKTSFYSPLGAESYKHDLFKQFDAYKANKDPAAKAAIEKALNDHYGHYKIHSYIGGFGMSTKAEFVNLDEHKKATTSFFESMIKGGDGKSAATAFKVTEVSEEYFMVRYLTKTKGKVIGQSLHTENNHAYDVLEVENVETKEKMKVWFNVDTSFANYDKVLKKSQPDNGKKSTL